MRPSLALSFAVLFTACGKKDPSPSQSPTPAPSAPAPSAPASSAPAPAAPEPATPAPATTTSPAPAPATSTPATSTSTPSPTAPATPTPPAPTPTELSNFDAPRLQDIPDKPLHGKLNGKPFGEATVEIGYTSSEWTIKVNLADGELFSETLSPELAVPGAGFKRERERGFGGYVHRREPGAAASDRPVSLNAPHGAAFELTAWDVAAWAADKGMQQPGGKVSGRLAIAYDADTWVAGTFTTDFTWFGEPPAVRAETEAKARAEAVAALGPWVTRPAPEGVVAAVGDKVICTYRLTGGGWGFGRATVSGESDGVLALDSGALTTRSLVRPAAAMPPAAAKKGDVVAVLDHLGLQLARVEAEGDPVKVSYLGPSGAPRDNDLGADRVIAWASAIDGPGAPPTVAFERDGERLVGMVVARAGDGFAVLLAGDRELVEQPAAALTLWPPATKLGVGAKVEAYFGCAMVPWKVRAATVKSVLGGGLGYEVAGEDCVQTIQARYVRKR